MKSQAIVLTLIAAIYVAATGCGGARPRPPADKTVIDVEMDADGGDTLTRDELGIAIDTPTIARHPSELAFDALDWKIPLGDGYRATLANGMVVYAAVDSSLPLVSVEAHIRSGALNDPAGKEGLGSLLTRLLRGGGTALYPPDTLDALIDLYAMKFSFTQTEGHILFNASFLAEYADTAMNIMRQMFFHPRFDGRRLERERSMMIENVRHRFVNPGPTLAFAYRKHQYPQSPASSLSTEAGLRSMTRKDLVALHEKAFGGSAEMILTVSGMFDRDSMLAKLNDVFANTTAATAKGRVPMQYAPAMWESAGAQKARVDSNAAALPLFPEIKIAPKAKALVVHKNINQTYIRMGLPLFRRPHEDYYAVSLMNYILGGSGFISRLGMRVRSDEGLTYSIHSRAESNYIYDGTLFIDFFTNTESYPRAVSIILEELGKVVTDGVTESELENARSSLIAELPSSFRSPGDIASTYAWNEFYRRAPDHYVKYPDELAKLTLDDIKKAARKYIDMDKITYTLVGDTTAINAASKLAVENKFFSIDLLESKKVIIADSIVKLP